MRTSVYAPAHITRYRTELITGSSPVAIEDQIVAFDRDCIEVGKRLYVADITRNGWVTVATQEWQGDGFRRGGEWVTVSSRKVRTRDLVNVRRVIGRGHWLIPGWVPDAAYLASLPGSVAWVVAETHVKVADPTTRDAVRVYMDAAERYGALVEWQGEPVTVIVTHAGIAETVGAEVIAWLRDKGCAVVSTETACSGFSAHSRRPLLCRLCGAQADVHNTEPTPGERITETCESVGHYVAEAMRTHTPDGVAPAAVTLRTVTDTRTDQADTDGGAPDPVDQAPTGGYDADDRCKGCGAHIADPHDPDCAGGDQADADGGAPDPVDRAQCGCPRATLALVAPHTPVHVPSIGHRADCALHVELSPVDQADATPDQADAADTDQGAGVLVATVDRDALYAALTLAKWGIPARPAVPILAGVLLTGDGGPSLTVATFDYEVSARTVVPSGAAVTGSVLVDVADLLAAVKGFPSVKATKGKPVPAGANTVTLTQSGATETVTVTCGTRTVALSTMPVVDYPTLPEVPATVATAPARGFAAAVARVAPAAGTDDTLPLLTMVEVTADADGKRACLAATDRYRAVWDAFAWTPAGEAGAIPSALVPAKTLAYVATLAGAVAAPVAVGYVTGHGSHTPMVAFTFGPHTVTTRTGDGTFPGVKGLMPSAFAGEITVPAKAMAAMVKSLATGAKKDASLTCTVAGQSVTLTVGTATDTIPCDTSLPDGFTIKFNHGLLTSALAAIGTGTAAINVVEAFKPALVTSPDAPEFKALVMPLRIADDKPKAKEATMSAKTPAAPATVAATPTPDPVATPDTVPATVDRVERMAADGHAAMLAGDYAGARVLIHQAEQAAPAGYLVGKGRLTFAAVVALIDAAERVARPVAVAPAPVAPVAATPTPAAPAPVDQAPAAPATPAATGGCDPRPVLAQGSWSRTTLNGTDVDVLTLPGGRLAREVYTAVAGAVSGIGGTWNRGQRGFVFPATTPSARVLVDAIVAGERALPVDQADDQVDAFDPRTVLAGATWGIGRVGTGKAALTVDVLTLPAGRLTRDQYMAVKAVITGMGGVWKRTVNGFAFARSEARYDNTRTVSGCDRLATYLGAPDVAPVAPVAPAAPVAPVVVAGVSVAPTLAPVDAAVIDRARVAAIEVMTSAPAPIAAPVAPAGTVMVAFTLEEFSKTGVSYRAGRAAVRDALASAGFRCPVVKDDAARRVFTVACAVSDQARVSAVVAGAVVLSGVTV